MNVLVDTCIWSLALRRSLVKEDKYVFELNELIQEQRVIMLGAIRQELLSGIRNHNQFELLRNSLRAFDDLPLLKEDYETAADFYTICRRSGIQGSNTDFLLCAVSANYSIPVFTVDMDFSGFKKQIPISLYYPR